MLEAIVSPVQFPIRSALRVLVYLFVQSVHVIRIFLLFKVKIKMWGKKWKKIENQTFSVRLLIVCG